MELYLITLNFFTHQVVAVFDSVAGKFGRHSDCVQFDFLRVQDSLTEPEGDCLVRNSKVPLFAARLLHVTAFFYCVFVPGVVMPKFVHIPVVVKVIGFDPESVDESRVARAATLDTFPRGAFTEVDDGFRAGD